MQDKTGTLCYVGGLNRETPLALDCCVLYNLMPWLQRKIKVRAELLTTLSIFPLVLGVATV